MARSADRLQAPEGPSTTPELFATYVRLTVDACEVVLAHVEILVAQLTRIIDRGVERGEFNVPDPIAAARAVFDATSRFHNPAHASECSDPGIDDAFEGVWFLVLAGLGARGDLDDRR